MQRTEDDSPQLARLRTFCLSLPETSEVSSWGHPNFRAGKRTFVTYEWIRKRPSIAFRLPPREVAKYAAAPGSFLTPYGRGQWVSLGAEGRIDWRLTKSLILKSYRLVALKRMTHALGDPPGHRSGRRVD